MPWSLLAAGINKTIDLPFQAYDNWQENQFLESQEKIAQQQLDLAEREYYSNVDIMNRNFGLQQEAFNYNKQQAELTRMREDNAFQRRVADTVKAGFSPLATEGVASASQSPTLTAPQLDPQGVNQAVQNRLSAYDKKMQVEQNKLNQSNINSELRLKNLQLSLAQIETAKGIFESVYNSRRTEQEIKRLGFENDYYSTHGYKDTTFNTILNDILKNVNFGDKTPGEAIADSINEIINDSDKSATQVITDKVHNYARSNFIKNLNDESKISHFVDLLNKAKNGYLSFWDIDKAKKYARLQFGFDLNIKTDRMKSLSDTEVENILNSFFSYRSSLIGGGK